MSGSAALSAARKRRASSSQMGGGGGGGSTNTSSPSASYYGGSKQSLQGIMNQAPPSYPGGMGGPPQVPQAYALPREHIPNIPMNIYENIELIKQQLSERTKLIQTQGSSIPPEKLRVLHKQNEIQTQILRQKMMIAQQMEAAEQQKQMELHEQYTQQNQRISQMPVNPNEPEFIYEKGIPRKNPRYKKPEDVKPMVSVSQYSGEPVSQSQFQSQSQSYSTPNSGKGTMKPFVSMITDTGVIPPPIVILKSHDATLADHHYMLQELVSQMGDLQSKTSSIAAASVAQASADQQQVKVTKSSSNNETQSNVGSKTADSDADPDADEDEENVLLMEEVMNDLTNSREFIEGVVDKIVNETNLSEVIMKIDPIIKENQELRSLIFSQQQMMNEMNMLLFRLMNEQQKISEAAQQAAQQAAQAAQAAMTNAHAHAETNHSHEPVMEIVANEIEIRDDGLNDNGLYSSEPMEVVILSEQEQEPIVQEESDNEPLESDNHDNNHDHDHDNNHDHDHDHDNNHDHDHNDEEEPDYRSITPTYDDYNDIRSEPVSLVVSELLENAY